MLKPLKWCYIKQNVAFHYKFWEDIKHFKNSLGGK